VRLAFARAGFALMVGLTLKGVLLRSAPTESVKMARN
jgi:hypothetical protein